MLCEEFMASSGSQLTIHGLFELGSALEHEEIAVFFRNNHFSTIYKRGVCPVKSSFILFNHWFRFTPLALLSHLFLTYSTGIISPY